MPFAAILLSAILTAGGSEPGGRGGFHACIDWVEEARSAVRQSYPGADTVDFQYVGCRARSPSRTDYVYKYWLREAGQGEFGVYATVEADTAVRKPLATYTERAGAAGIVPREEKWRRAAVRAVKRAYPGAAIVDSRPYECRWLNRREAAMEFTFWLRDESGRSQFKLAIIRYRPAGERIVAIDIRDRRIGGR